MGVSHNMKNPNHYKQCCCPECRPNVLDPQTQKRWDDWADTRVRNVVRRLHIDGRQFEDEILKKHIMPIVDLLNETRRDILVLRKELGLPLPKDDARLETVGALSAQDRQRETLRAKRKAGEVRQDDSQAEDEFMEQCIANLEDQGVDDAEDVCQALWEEQDE